MDERYLIAIAKATNGMFPREIIRITRKFSLNQSLNDSYSLLDMREFKQGSRNQSNKSFSELPGYSLTRFLITCISYESLKKRLLTLAKWAFQSMSGKNEAVINARPSGILLYGPSGCGKTEHVKALVNSLEQECQDSIHLIAVKGSELFSKYYGETEQRLRAIFQQARLQVKPCVLFFDEIEVIGRKRSINENTSRKFVLFVKWS